MRRVALFHLVLLAACSKSVEGGKGAAPLASEDPHPVVVSASVEKARIDVGDSVKYLVLVRARKGFVPDLPALLDNVPVFLDQGPWDRKTREDGLLEATKWTTLDPGIGPHFTIAPAVVKFTDPDGRSGEARSEETTVEIKSRLAAGETIPDIKERLDVRIPAEPRAAEGVNWWILGGAGVATLALCAFAVRVFLRSRRAEAARPRPPWEDAMEELRRLHSSSLVEQGRVQEFYVDLSGIVRRYVERRFLITAPEMTTTEFLRAARSHSSLSDAHKELLEGFLEASDLVKFARYVPEAGEAGQALAAAERLVRESSFDDMQPEEVPAEAGPGSPTAREARGRGGDGPKAGGPRT